MLKFFFGNFGLPLSIGLLAYSGGSGAEGERYQISSLAALTRLTTSSSDWDKCFIQTADTGASASQYWDDADDDSDGNLYDDSNDATSTGSNEGWSPMVNESTRFSGSYDGDGHTISNLPIHDLKEQLIAILNSQNLLKESIPSVGMEPIGNDFRCHPVYTFIR